MILEGRAREGTESIATQLERLVADLRDRFETERFEYSPSPSGDRFTLEFSLFAPPLEVEETQESDDEAAG